MTSSSWNRSVELDSRDRLLTVLSTDCVRDVVQYFQASPEDVAELDELAEIVATRTDDPGFRDSERVAGYLHHVTLPKLATAGIVDYDQRQHTVRYRGQPMVEKYSTMITQTNGEG